MVVVLLEVCAGRQAWLGWGTARGGGGGGGAGVSLPEPARQPFFSGSSAGPPCCCGSSTGATGALWPSPPGSSPSSEFRSCNREGMFEVTEGSHFCQHKPIVCISVCMSMCMSVSMSVQCVCVYMSV